MGFQLDIEAYPQAGIVPTKLGRYKLHSKRQLSKYLKKRDAYFVEKCIDALYESMSTQPKVKRVIVILDKSQSKVERVTIFFEPGATVHYKDFTDLKKKLSMFNVSVEWLYRKNTHWFQVIIMRRR